MTRGIARLKAILGFKCPRCGEGNLFVGAAYRPADTARMHTECPSCKLDLVREPGFYFGAAYVSYALTVALWVAVLVALLSFDAWGWITFGFFTHVGTFLTTGIVLLLLLLPLIYRLSRSIWVAMFTK
jgi:predicted RNA-binding Zn-ribbon protein involved in translation (DUF1610 family)